jgi:hypothetical protein
MEVFGAKVSLGLRQISGKMINKNRTIVDYLKINN